MPRVRPLPILLVVAMSSCVLSAPIRSAAAPPVPSDPVGCPTPQLDRPADGSATSDTTPIVIGRACPGARIDVVLDGSIHPGVAVTDAAGIWSYTPGVPLVEGPHRTSVVARSSDDAAQPSDENRFAVDTIPPAAPTITSPTDGTALSGTLLVPVTGTAEPDARVDISIDGRPAQTGTVDPDGRFAVSVDSGQSGTHTLVARTTDRAGHPSPSSPEVRVTTYVAPPAPPVLLQGPFGSTNDTTPTFTWRARAGVNLRIFLDGVAVSTGTVGAEGQLGFTPSTPLAETEHETYAVATAPDGTVETSGVTWFLVDATPPPTPVLEAPTDGRVVAPQPTFRAWGQGRVEFYVDGRLLGTAFPNENDHEVFFLDDAEPLPGGEHIAYVVAVDDAGNRSGPSRVVAFTVDASTPTTPVLDDLTHAMVTSSPALRVGGTTSPDVSVRVRRDSNLVATVRSDARGRFALPEPLMLTEGRHSIGAIAVNDVGTTSDAVFLLLTVDLTAPRAPALVSPVRGALVPPLPELSGTGEAAATVHAAIDQLPAGTSTVGKDGRWVLDVVQPLAAGPHTVVVGQRDAAGHESPTVTSSFVVQGVVSPTPAPVPTTRSHPHPRPTPPTGRPTPPSRPAPTASRPVPPPRPRLAEASAADGTG